MSGREFRGSSETEPKEQCVSVTPVDTGRLSVDASGSVSTAFTLGFFPGWGQVTTG